MKPWPALAMCVAGCGRVGFDSSTGATITQSVLRFDRTVISQPLTDVPVLVVLDDTRADRSALCADASDLRFYDGDGQLLAHELESAGTAGGDPVRAWVRVPELTATTQIVATYGAADLPPASTDEVFDAPYAAVIHFGEITGELTEATAQGHDVVAFGTQPARAEIGWGRSFERARAESIEIVTAPDLAFPAFTVSGWIDETVLPADGDFHAMVSREHNADGNDVFWLGDAGGHYHGSVTIAPAGTAPTELELVGPAATVGTWAHLTLTAGPTMATLYVDGHPVTAVPLASPPDDDSRRPIYLGADDDELAGPPPPDDLLDGVLDEVRLEHVERPDDWVLIDDLAMRDALISYGAIEHGIGKPPASRCTPPGD